MPDGLCECGCGQPAPIANYTDRKRGYIKGHSTRFIIGHQRRLKFGEEYDVVPGPLDTPCWIWRAKGDADGYGIVSREGKREMAHRYIWKRSGRRLMATDQLDHLCHDPETCPGGRKCPHRRCVNPDHMRITPARENILRGSGPTAQNARKTHCKHEHLLAGANLHIRPDGGRECRECSRAKAARRRAKIAADPQLAAEMKRKQAAYWQKWKAKQE